MANIAFGAGTVEITNNSDRVINIQFYRVNLWTPVAAGDTLTLEVDSSEEAAYYKGLEEDSKGITFSKMDGTPTYLNPTGLISVKVTLASNASEGEGDGN